MELVEHPGKGEIERTQAEDREDIRGIDDERILGDSEDCRNRIDREDQIGNLHEDENHEERRGHEDAIFTHEKLVAAEVAGGWNIALEKAHHGISLGVDFLLPLDDHFHPRKDEECAEDVDDPCEFRDQLGPERDHDGTHDQRTEDPPEQNLVLIERGHRKIREKQCEDKDVVHAQRLLDYVAGEKFQPFIIPHVMGDSQVK